MSDIAIVSWSPERVILMASRATWTALVERLASDTGSRALHRAVVAAIQRAEGTDVQRVTLKTDDAGDVLRWRG